MIRNWFPFFHRKRAAAKQRPTCLRLEVLESRDCPTATITNMNVLNVSGSMMQVTGAVSDTYPGEVTVDFSGVLSGSVNTFQDGSFLFTAPASGAGTFTATAIDNSSNASDPYTGVVPGWSESNDCGSPTDSGPTITSFNAVSADCSTVQVTGIVQDPNPQLVTVNFSGPISGSATPDADGLFTLTTTYSGTGEITAQAVDEWGQTSNAATCTMPSSGSSGPTITGLIVTNTGGTTVQVSGTLNDNDPSSATVSFGGVVSGSTTPNWDGTFSFTATASVLGAVTAQATDSQNLTSPTTYTEVTSNAPVIDQFYATHLSGSVWEFSGHVSDASPTSAQVTFTTPDSWNGTTVTPDGGGNFGLITTVGSDGPTAVSVQATDCWNLTSASVTCQQTGGAPFGGDLLNTGPPVITTATAARSADNVITVSGFVNDNTGQPVSVFIVGLQTVNSLATTDANGNFTISINLLTGETGTLTLEAVNSAGVSSALVTIYVPGP